MIIKKMTAGLALLLCAPSAMSDIWETLYSEKLQEAINGNSEAQYDVGAMHQNGRGVKADRSEAIKWYEKAAAQGDTKAQSRLKLMQANTTRFNKTLRQTAGGNQESLYDLGNMHMKGVGTNIDYTSAINAFKQSAGQGHIKSAYKLGLIYHEGAGVRTSNKDAFKWFRQAAENGYPAAQYYLGKLYAEGTGTRQNRTEALVWFSKAVDGGFDQARAEMINISDAVNVAKTKAEPAAVKEKKAPKNIRAARKAKPARARKAAIKRYSLEDLMLASWSRDGNPVSYLPSAINTCRGENKKLICFSDDQTRKAGANTIKFKTKAFISNFSGKGSFNVTYRNLVVHVTQQTTSNTDEAVDEPGSLDNNQKQSYQVKTGWSNPHRLECKMKSSGTVSCIKNNTHAFLLTSPTTLAAGD